MNCAIILVNYNGEKYNTACIESILNAQESDTCKIYVVDNASADQSMSILTKQYASESRVELIYLDDNYGFSYANNVGIRKALEDGAETVLLLNNDTEIKEDMLSQLFACGKRHPGAMIAPKIYYSDRRNVIWSAGGTFSPIVKKAKHTGLNCKDLGQFDEEEQIEFATGCAMYIPKEIVEQAGYLDEDFFLYYEDTEYCFRLQEKGIAIYYCPQAVLYHKVGASSKGADSPLCAYYIARNWLICARKHLGRRYPLFRIYYGINRIACCGLWLIRGRKKLVKATVWAVQDYRKKRFGRAERDWTV